MFESTELTSSTLESIRGCTWIHKHRALSNKENTQEEKAKISKRNNFKLCFQELQWGALYRPKRVKGHPSDMTPDKTTQCLETITLTPCLCQGIGLTQQKEASRPNKRHFRDSGNCRIWHKIFVISRWSFADSDSSSRFSPDLISSNWAS